LGNSIVVFILSILGSPYILFGIFYSMVEGDGQALWFYIGAIAGYIAGRLFNKLNYQML
jgi:hypothetical protein